MLGRANRFHGRASLQRAYQKSQTVRSGLLSLKFTKTPRQDYRLAIVVSKKVSKSAVVRNRIRRRLYEIIRLQSGNFNGVYDMVLVVYGAEVATMPAPELAGEVDKLLSRAKIVSAHVKLVDKE